MMMWFYVMTGEERYRALFEETIAWLRSMEQPHGSRASKHPWLEEASLAPVGWPSEYPPRWHRSLDYRLPILSI